MPNNQVIHIVGTRCQAQVEEKFNKWYNEVHIPLLKKYKGLKNVARYKVAGEPGNMPVYIAIYTFASQKDLDAFGKSPEFAAAIEEMNESWPTGFEIVSRTQYNLLKEW
jgi:uncharacterized protein (TIGR02118 family)